MHQSCLANVLLPKPVNIEFEEECQLPCRVDAKSHNHEPINIFFISIVLLRDENNSVELPFRE